MEALYRLDGSTVKGPVDKNSRDGGSMHDRPEQTSIVVK